MADERMYNLEKQINNLENLKKQLRNREKDIKAREAFLANPSAFQYNSVKSLQANLGQALQPNMMPGNVGGINEVTWPFYFQADLDMGADPTFNDTTIVKTSFQVDQEAALLLMSVGISFSTDVNGLSAAQNAPLQMEIIDRQSSRRFNNAPIPLQMVGRNSCPSIFPTPFYLQPNAFLDIQVSGLSSFDQQFNGSGEIQFSFFGYRIRVQDAQKILSTIFG